MGFLYLLLGLLSNGQYRGVRLVGYKNIQGTQLYMPCAAN